MRRGMRAVAGVGLLLGVLLSGCVAIPTSGDVQTVPLDVDPDELTPIFLPESPVDGMTQVDILRGFIRAGRGPQNDYEVAREYLAPGFADEWSGTAQVLISSTPIEPVAVDDVTLSISVSVSAEVDATGRYTTVSSQQARAYGFALVDGEWRIASAPPGIVLTPNGFELAFAEYPLYFYDPSFRFLVPDARWFPVTRTAARRLVAELLAGPAPWLGSGVLVSAFPAGVSGAASYDAPQVDVELGGAVRTESALAQRRMLWQLETTIRGAFGNVTEIAVTADGLPLAPAADEGGPENLYSVREVFGGFGGQVGTLGADGVTPLPSPIGTRADALEATAASLGRLRTSLAALGPAGVSYVGPTGDPVTIDTRPGLVAPSLDPHGYVWTVPADDPDGLVATSPDDLEPHPIALDADGTVVTIQVSRDGARLLVVLTTEQGPRVFVAGILRDADLVPLALSTPYELPVTGTVLDGAWVDGERIAVLLSRPAGARVEVLALGGPGERIDGAGDAVELVGGSSVDGIRVLTTDGVVLRPSSAGIWVDTGLAASFLGTQQ